MVEAEHYHAAISRSGKKWTARNDVNSGFAGTAAMVAETDSGAFLDTNFATTSPELQYRVRFNTTGTYNVWMRGWGVDDGGNSVHVGINGAGVSSADRISLNTLASWQWTKSTMDNSSAQITISNPGTYTINVWMREDGVRFDRLMFTKSTSTPSGTGASESPRADGSAPNAAPVARTNGPYTRATNQAVTFDGTASTDAGGTITSYRWTFGDGATATGATASHAYASGGTFSVKLVVTDERGATGSVTTTATISAPPSAPTNLTAEGRTREIRLQWQDRSSVETSYRIERSTSSSSGFVEIANVSANVVSFTDKNREKDKTYYYRVRAANGSVYSAYSNTANARAR